MEKKKFIIISIILCITFLLLGIIVGYSIEYKINNSNKKKDNETNQSNDNQENETLQLGDILDDLLGEYGMCTGEWTCYGLTINKDDNNKYTYNIYQTGTEGERPGEIISIAKIKDNKYLLTIHYDAYEDELTSVVEHTTEAEIDTSKISQDILILSQTEYQKITGDIEEAFNEKKEMMK